MRVLFSVLQKDLEKVQLTFIKPHLNLQSNTKRAVGVGSVSLLLSVCPSPFSFHDTGKPKCIRTSELKLAAASALHKPCPPVATFPYPATSTLQPDLCREGSSCSCSHSRKTCPLQNMPLARLLVADWLTSCPACDYI